MSVNPLIQVYDVIGLGFGPSNLAIAGAFIENQLDSPISTDRLCFIERQDEFKWHPAMLLPGARMQISFLKDLATLRSPQSPITFISYLHSQNRLVDFINRGRTIPTRKEYSDYLSWAAQIVQDRGVKVAFGEEVVALEEMDRFTIQVRTRMVSSGQHIVRLAKNIIISPGGSPRIPGPLATNGVQERVIHSSTYLSSVAPLLNSLQSNKAGNVPLRLAVIGSGQSAAEIVMDLHARLATMSIVGNKAHTLDLIIRKGSLKPSDDSPFVNEIFNPEMTDEVFRLPHSARREVRFEYASANYGVVNPHTLESLYEILYDQKLDDGISKRIGRSTPLMKPKLAILNYSEILSAETTHPYNAGTSQTGLGPVTLILQQTLRRSIYEKSYDAIICATGYERQSWARLMTNSGLGKHFGLDESVRDCVHLEVEADMHKDVHLSPESGVDHKDGSPDPSISSGSTTPTSLDWVPDWRRTGGEPGKKIGISRAYRLLPKARHGEEGLEARIYVQGLAEETHGLSDTLLSVIAVRAGEVVDDLCEHFTRDMASGPDAKLSTESFM